MFYCKSSSPKLYIHELIQLSFTKKKKHTSVQINTKYDNGIYFYTYEIDAIHAKKSTLNA